MSVPVQDAAEALVPFFAAGADAALGELARKAGSSLSETALHALERIRARFSGQEVNAAGVETALADALADGSLSDDDIGRIAELKSVIHKTYALQVGRNAYVDTVIKVDGGGSFNG